MIFFTFDESTFDFKLQLCTTVEFYIVRFSSYKRGRWIF